MREILFRGERVDNGEWVYGAFVPDLREVYFGDEIDGFIKPFGKTKEERLMVEVDRKTVGQYTGLTDKNGVKIFEGDILRGKPGNFTVRWSESICSFVAGKDTKMLPCMNVGTMKHLEVIGNIYDNPELQ